MESPSSAASSGPAGVTNRETMKGARTILLYGAISISAAVVLAAVISLLGGQQYLELLWSWSSGVLSLAAPVPLFFIAGALYLVPTIVAYRIKHHNAAAIFALNFLLGWTLLGWIAALIWSLTRPPPPAIPPAPSD